MDEAEFKAEFGGLEDDDDDDMQKNGDVMKDADSDCHYLLHCPNWARQRRLMVRSVRHAVSDRIDITEHLLLGVSAVAVSTAQQRSIVSAVAVFAKSTIADRWWVW